MILIYQLISPSGKSYVGVTSNLKRRLKEHRKGQQAIGEALRKYGQENFEIEILAKAGSYAKAHRIERSAIRQLGTMAPDGYNLHRGGRGGAPTEEVRQRISAAHSGKVLTEEHRRKIAAARRQHLADPAERQRISESVRRYLTKNSRTLSSEHRRRIAESVRATRRRAA